MINKGDKIPLTTKLPNTNISLKDYFKDNTYLVLYFYPEDLTPACTKQACSFRDNSEQIKKDFDAKIVGVSPDSKEKHEKFIEKEKLNFDLIADEDLKLHNFFGVYGEKKSFGRTVISTLRTTFLIDSTGLVLQRWGGAAKINTKKHGEEVYKYLSSLNS